MYWVVGYLAVGLAVGVGREVCYWSRPHIPPTMDEHGTALAMGMFWPVVLAYGAIYMCAKGINIFARSVGLRIQKWKKRK